ncbi:MAG: AbrB/MazE/SpoVT family DNA-binding domain-containing protein [Candidatus Nanohaloarchaea archaeon]|nr:AbrB/MazE/SpoVT family DNA-binding domain-containing protein [Candidatus Nanohaloarchaea archaeon]
MEFIFKPGMSVAEVGKVGARGQVTIPKEIREEEGLEPGDNVIFIQEDGVIVMEKLSVERWKERVEEVSERYDGPTSAEEIAEMLDD